MVGGGGRGVLSIHFLIVKTIEFSFFLLFFAWYNLQGVHGPTITLDIPENFSCQAASMNSKSVNFTAIPARNMV